MVSSKADILARLKKDMLLLQGVKTSAVPGRDTFGLGGINAAFPDGCFPAAGVHEFLCYNREEQTASSAFIAGLLSTLMRGGAPVLWISSGRTIFPPALKSFGISPEAVIFLPLSREEDIAWAVEEALRCNTLAAVVGELSRLSFTASRRFQLAIEKSRVALFLLRPTPKDGTTASLTRWHIQPLHSRTEEGAPGVGHPRWSVKLLKVRNGQPGVWELEWVRGAFRHGTALQIVHQQHKKTG